MKTYLVRLLNRAPHLYAWEKEYKLKGKLWRGVSTSFDFASFLPTGVKVLELGCGDGKTLAALVAADFQVTGVDVSPTAVNLAKEKIGVKVKFVVGDVCRLPFKGKSFDAVVAIHVFDHLTESERKLAVEEAKRVLKPGGILFFEGFSVKDFRFGKGIEVEPKTFRRKNNVWYHYFSLVEVKKLFFDFELVNCAEECVSRSISGQKVDRCTVKFIGKK